MIKAPWPPLLLTIALFSAPLLAATNPWLSASLYGSDNRYAALRGVTLSGEAGHYQVLVKNQFGFQCELSFNAAQQPSQLSHCDSPEQGEQWRVKEPHIKLRCTTRTTEVVCRGSYTLQAWDPSQKGFSTLDPREKDYFTIARKR
ncbi:hypothetical protein [Gallaecimonas mangrovi]|uniref:hypothetical protein n=1 Tax=Gallaecimonas mangrovi TaxID=2291597 RepID=UPI000E1FE41F|nr:hypothetical protein [Gallaecimonas mangrovi]